MIQAIELYPSLYHSIGWALIHSLWQVSVIVFILASLRNFGWIKKPGIRYQAGILGLFLILIAFITSIFFYFEPYLDAGVQNGYAQVPGQMVTPAVDHSLSSLLILGRDWIDTHTGQLALGWVIGFILFGIKLSGGLFYILRLKKQAIVVKDPVLLDRFSVILEKAKIPYQVKLFVSDRIISPMVFGLYRATILLPLSHINQLNPDQTEMILAHELAHIIRKDFLVNLIVQFVKTVLYFHPGIWWINTYIEEEREKATDELALRLCCNPPIAYAKTLMEAQEISRNLDQKDFIARRRHAIALPFFNTKKQLLERIESLLGGNPKQNHRFTHFSFLLVLSGIIFLLGFTDIGLPGRTAHPAFALDEKILNEGNSYQTYVHAVLDTLVVEIKAPLSGKMRSQLPSGKEFVVTQTIQSEIRNQEEEINLEIEINEGEDEFMIGKKMGFTGEESQFGTFDVLTRIDLDVADFVCVDSIIFEILPDLVGPQKSFSHKNRFPSQIHSENNKLSSHFKKGKLEKSIQMMAEKMERIDLELIQQYKLQTRLMKDHNDLAWTDSLLNQIKMGHLEHPIFDPVHEMELLIPESQAGREFERKIIILSQEYEVPEILTKPKMGNKKVKQFIFQG